MRQPRGAAGPILLRSIARERRLLHGDTSPTARRLVALADWIDAGCPAPDERAPEPASAPARDPVAPHAHTGRAISVPGEAPVQGSVRPPQTFSTSGNLSDTLTDGSEGDE